MSVFLTVVVHSHELDDYLKSWGLCDAGFNYNVVSLFGSQSTGKSLSFVSLDP